MFFLSLLLCLLDNDCASCMQQHTLQRRAAKLHKSNTVQLSFTGYYRLMTSTYVSSCFQSASATAVSNTAAMRSAQRLLPQLKLQCTQPIKTLRTLLQCIGCSQSSTEGTTPLISLLTAQSHKRSCQ
jgi:hypothetical protein